MAKGRIKRLQAASSWQGQSFKADALEVCALCEREIPRSRLMRPLAMALLGSQRLGCLRVKLEAHSQRTIA